MILKSRAQLFGLAAMLLTSAGASAQYARDNGPRDAVETSRQTGGYCDRSGCPDRFWRYRIYYGPVFYHGQWFRGPVYVKDDHGRNWFWVAGGWHRDEWHTRRPEWARHGYFGPALPRDYYQANNFGDRFPDSGQRPGDWRDRQAYRDNRPEDGSRGYQDNRGYGGDSGTARTDTYPQDRRYSGMRDGRQGYGTQDSTQNRDPSQPGASNGQSQRAPYGQDNAQGGGRNHPDSRSAGGGPTHFTDQNPNTQGGRSMAQAQSQPAAIGVASATYGGSCKAPKGNATQAVQAACNGKSSCQYTVNHLALGDPAPGCRKDFAVAWTCGTGTGGSAWLPGEASGATVNLSCPAGVR